MRGPKLNEGATAVGERHGTKATAKYVRSSAYKARVVLDLIRGLDVRRADEVLQFTDRSIAHDIRKVLASAVANATDVDNGAYIADADELFVLACFADEGPTLRRFRPRARGRATRIRKRTCHITIVVARMSDERIEIVRARAEGTGGGTTAANRRARVERSRKRAAAAKAQIDAIDADEAVEDAADEIIDDAETVAVDDAGIDTGADTDEVEPGEAEPDQVDAGADHQPGEWPGSVMPDADGNGPDTHPIKGNADSMLYHTPDSRYYKVTKAEVWFDTEESAEAAGFSKPGSKTDDAAATAEASAGDEADSTEENGTADEGDIS
jgi:large subunit ribosomal protein L22